MHYIDIEIIQTLPFANANRDDSGLPKSVIFGDSTRGRLSSQALKRAARFYEAGKEPGYVLAGENKYYRTQLLHKLVQQELLSRGVPEDDPRYAAVPKLFEKAKILGSLKKDKGDALAVFTQEEISRVADVFENGEEIDAKTIEHIVLSSSKRDLALWGRFFASGPQLSLDGAAQVAHAFTTHSVNLENDFFTGMDDAHTFFPELSGAGHPDNAFYETGTFFKYANANIEEAVKNILNLRKGKQGEIASHGKALSGDEVAEEIKVIVKEFLESFALSIPPGKIRSTAHTTLPSFIRVAVRKGRPVNAATAFYQSVKNSDNITKKSISRLGKEHEGLERITGKPELSRYISLGEFSDDSGIFGEESESLDKLLEEVSEYAKGIALDFRNQITITDESEADGSDDNIADGE